MLICTFILLPPSSYVLLVHLAQVIGDVKGTILPWIIQASRICCVRLPLPWLPWRLPSILSLEVCKPNVAASTGGWLNPEFLQLPRSSRMHSNEKAPSKLPSFDDLFDPPSMGRFHTASASVIVDRDKPSVLQSTKSSAMKFAAEVFYPIDSPPVAIYNKAEAKNQLRVAKGGPFPIVAFSPGYRGVPSHFKRTLGHIASQGIIVISQLSTHHLGVDSYNR